MISEIHKINFLVYEEKDWKIITKIKNKDIQRSIVLFKNEIVVIYTTTEIKLLEIKKGKYGKKGVQKLKEKYNIDYENVDILELK
jgi:hypothetical protein